MKKLGIILLTFILSAAVTGQAQQQNKCVTSRAAVASAQKSLQLEKKRLSSLDDSLAAQEDRDTKRASSLQARSQFAEAAAQSAVEQATKLGLSCIILPQPCTTDAESEARAEIIRAQGRAQSRKRAYTLWIARMKQRSENSAERRALQRSRVEKATARLAEKEEDLRRCLAL
jgi:hypothetical protein